MFPRETYILNHFAIVIISFLFLYAIVNYHWKGFKESYNFTSQKYFNQNLYAKVIIKQNIEHICSPRKFKFLLLGVHDCSLGKKKIKLFPGAT